jgi:hypothetical protein
MASRPPLSGGGRRWLQRSCGALGLAVALALGSGCALAQATSSTQIGSLEQSQSGALNQQEARIGDAAGASSNVAIGSVVQSQSGLMNRQQLDIGDAADGDSTRVDLGSLVQQQPGPMPDPSAGLNKSPGGSRNPQGDRPAQWYYGAPPADDDAGSGNTPPNVRGILQAGRRVAGDPLISSGNPARITNR